MSIESDVSVWYLVLSKVQEEFWTQYRACLTDGERERADRFHFEKDRRAYTAARALVRASLSRFEQVNPQDWRFKQNSYGKPEIDQPISGRRLQFNLSHTDGLVACAVSTSRSVGVDVESLDRIAADLKVAESFFAPQEVDQLKSVDISERQDTFFNFWTLKESYIKALGFGLSLSLDSFGFDLETGRLLFASEESPNDWHFKRMKPTSRHRLAVAAKGDHGEAVQFAFNEVSPDLSPL